MSDVQAVGMDVVTEKSDHQITGMAVSVCITPAAPAPLPIPYPTMGMVSEGIVDSPMRTKIDGAPIATVGSCAKVCHGNEAGTLKEVVSLNTGGPSFPIMGAPTVLIELGMAGITGSPCMMNKAITVGAPANATDADGTGGAGSGSGSGAASTGDASKSSGPSAAAGAGGGGTSTAAAAPTSTPTAEERKLAAAPGDTPEQRAARKKVAQDFFATKGKTFDPSTKGNRPFKLPEEQGDVDSHIDGIDLSKPVQAGPPPPIPESLTQYHVPTRKGQYFAPAGSSASSLGLGPQGTDPRDGSLCTKSCDTYNMRGSDGSSPDYLNSTASPKTDTWSVKDSPQPSTGGGNQYYVPDQNKTTNLTGSP